MIFINFLFLNYYHLVKLHLICYGPLHIQKGVRLIGKIRFNISRKAKRVSLGEHSRVTSGINPISCGIYSWIRVEDGAVLEIGNYTSMSDVCLWAHEKIIIGNFCMIGGGCLFNDSNSHPIDADERRREFFGKIDRLKITNAPIIIQDDVFIGARCIICKGVTIGARSIIASGSVVVKDIPADCIAGGNPCRVIKIRTNSYNYL